MADPITTADSSAPLAQLVLELKDLVVGYVKQETVVPLRQLGRYIVFGLLGSLLLGLGVVLLGVGGLRALQTETGTTFAGDWSWAPYGILFVTLVVSGVAVWKVRNASLRRQERRRVATKLASAGEGQ
jgi:NO-binding membrane sensor protein with MHYT domain